MITNNEHRHEYPTGTELRRFSSIKSFSLVRIVAHVPELVNRDAEHSLM